MINGIMQRQKDTDLCLPSTAVLHFFSPFLWFWKQRIHRHHPVIRKSKNMQRNLSVKSLCGVYRSSIPQVPAAHTQSGSSCSKPTERGSVLLQLYKFAKKYVCHTVLIKMFGVWYCMHLSCNNIILFLSYCGIAVWYISVVGSATPHHNTHQDVKEMV